jgi:phospholipase/carboxylesterase
VFSLSYVQKEDAEGVVLTPTQAPRGSVIWLHGLGADGFDFVPIVPELRLPDTLQPRFVFPHAPVRAVTINSGARMRAWYDIHGLSEKASEDERGIRASGLLVEELIRREQTAGVAARNIVLAGFSQGGAIALHAGLRHREALAGIMALSTYLPLRGTLAAEAAPANQRIPILMCHGTYDPVLPIQLGELSRNQLLAQGYGVSWKSYPMQHQVCGPEIADISAWLQGVLGARELPEVKA